MLCHPICNRLYWYHTYWYHTYWCHTYW